MKIKLTESKLKQIVAESVKKILNESTKGIDENNVVPQNVAEKYGFKPEYGGFSNGLELWRGKLPKNNEEIKTLLWNLGIKKFTSYNLMNSTCRITVKPSPKKEYDYGQYGGPLHNHR